MIDKKIGQVPALPGVYIFKDKDGTPIYIGKAKSLKKRLASYFKPKNRSWKTDVLMSEAASYEHIVVKSENEALIVEAELIKTHQPKFNTLLKDGQPFVYLMISEHPSIQFRGRNPPAFAKGYGGLASGRTDFSPLMLSHRKKSRAVVKQEDLPQLKLVRNKKLPGTYFGPFIYKGQARSVHRFLLEQLQLYICNKKLPNGCLQFHLGRCAGSCTKTFDKQAYLFRLNLAKQILNGKNKTLERQLKEQIKLHSKKLEFEQAQKLAIISVNLRNIIAIIALKIAPPEHASIQFYSKERTPFDRLRMDEKMELRMNGEKNRFNPAKQTASPPLALTPARRSLWRRLGDFVFEIVSKGHPACAPKPLASLKTGWPMRELVEGSSGTNFSALLNLQKEPRIIDCFDISHFQSHALVGSCVRFIDGVPAKSFFRHFAIKTLIKQHDYAALQEIIQRRYRDKSDLPDLIVIDGGKGQLSAVKKVAPPVPVIGLAKREERIFFSGNREGVRLDLQSPEGKLLIALRDYAHHFAISYHRIKRRKNF